jgi:hypothetical protein
MAALRAAARRTIVERYDLRRICLPHFASLINRLVAGEPPEPSPPDRLPELADVRRG